VSVNSIGGADVCHRFGFYYKTVKGISKMAERIQLSRNDANTAMGRLSTKSDSWLQNMSNIEKEVQAMSDWFKGETGNALIALYQRCQKEIKKDIERFITEYNGTVDKAVNSLQDADSSVAKQIGGVLPEEAPPKADSVKPAHRPAPASGGTRVEVRRAVKRERD